MEQFKNRPARFLGISKFDEWQMKTYSIKYDAARDTPGIQEIIQNKLPVWIYEKTEQNDFPNYKIGVVIIHEAKDCIFTIVSWWVYDNVIQSHVYFSEYETPDRLIDYSDKGIRFCVFEMSIMQHESNSWVEHVLKQSSNPDWNSYLADYYKLDYV